MEHLPFLETLVTDWLTAALSQESSPQTVTRYRKALGDFTTWYTAEEGRPPTLTDLTPIPLTGYRNARQRTHKRQHVYCSHTS